MLIFISFIHFQGYIHPNFVIIGHKDAFCSTCPGDALYGEMKHWPNFSLVVPIPNFICDIEKTTEKATTTTTTTTTKKPTTTTKKPTTTTKESTTTEKPERKEKPIVVKTVPIYVYLSLSKSKKPRKCCYDEDWWSSD